MSHSSAIQKYLNNYAEPEICIATQLTHNTYQHVLVIPCFDEDTTFAVRLMNSDLWQQNILVIVIINQTENSEINQNNQLLWQFFVSQTFSQTFNACVLSGQEKSGSHFLIIDRFTSRQIPKKEGVGLARKIGCDLACALVYSGKIRSTRIHCTDADTELANNYFECLNQKHFDSKAPAAWIYNFKHIKTESCSEVVYEATQQYEASLRYYRNGLEWAKSPYAFYTIGSTLALDIEAYCHCRGFPKRAAAEDFYLLNKLAKYAPIQFMDDKYVNIISRTSLRAPFGTGPAVETIVKLLNNGLQYEYYSPQCFTLLKRWLEIKDGCFNAEPALDKIPMEIKQILKDLKFAEFITHSQKQIKSQNQFELAFHHWFDAFKTLKFIRLSQQYYYPSRPLEFCLKEALF